MNQDAAEWIEVGERVKCRRGYAIVEHVDANRNYTVRHPDGMASCYAFWQIRRSHELYAGVL